MGECEGTHLVHYCSTHLHTLTSAASPSRTKHLDGNLWSELGEKPKPNSPASARCFIAEVEAIRKHQVIRFAAGTELSADSRGDGCADTRALNPLGVLRRRT